MCGRTRKVVCLITCVKTKYYHFFCSCCFLKKRNKIKQTRKKKRKQVQTLSVYSSRQEHFFSNLISFGLFSDELEQIKE